MKSQKRTTLIVNFFTIFSLSLSLAFLSGCAGFHEKMMGSEVSFTDSTQLEVLKELNLEKQTEMEQVAVAEDISPFEEIYPFDEDAMSWSNLYAMMGGEGMAIFDANNDGLMDVYLCQNGQNWTRPTDENGVLKDKPRYMANMLYLNQGNDDQDNPLFKPIGELVRANDTFVEEELLPEDYLFPRKHPDDSKERWGRQSFSVAVADLNGDGLTDIIVGNIPPGMLWADPSTRRIVPTFVDPVGRQARGTKSPAPPFGIYLVQHEAKCSLNDKRESIRGEEFEGANSVYLNRGDKDGDGIPEWEDASRSSNLEGFRPTTSISIADFDLDGDLDVYTGNIMDNDYWMAGSTYLAGGINCLYINQLAETGEFRFEEKAAEFDVDGKYDEQFPVPTYYKVRKIPILPQAVSFIFFKMVPYTPEFLVINGVEAEKGEITWTTMVQDVNHDGYPDIWVGNDMGYLRLHINKEGKGFELTDHARSSRGGYWMSLTPGDFNRDGKEDLFGASVGGSIHNHSAVNFAPLDLFNPDILSANLAKEFLAGANDSTHDIIDGSDFSKTYKINVDHSRILPPDVAIPNNFRKPMKSDIPEDRFDTSTLDPYEFSWGSNAIDVQNDGYSDLYWIGSLGGRGGGLNSGTGTNPGRLLINQTGQTELPELSDAEKSEYSQRLKFADLTAEHHVFNILELKYDKLESEGYIYRQAPRQNWSKRDVVHSFDRSVWVAQGPLIQQRATNQDLIQCCEYGRTTLAVDLNNDGFEDMVVRNKGGYDSRSSNSSNLKAMIDGRPQVIPAHNSNFPTTTNFEPGTTRVFKNTYSKNNWIKVDLIDDSENTFNVQALGAKVIMNDGPVRVKRGCNIGLASSSNVPLHFGLGGEIATKVKVQWPDQEQTISEIDLKELKNTTITISKTKGLISE